MLRIDTLLPFLRQGMDDTDSTDYSYSNADLIETLCISVQAIEAGWKQGYTIVEGLDGATKIYSISPDPPEWFKIAIVLKAVILKKSFREKADFALPGIKITSPSKSEDLKEIKQIYQEIIDERRYDSAFAVINSWDDLKYRIDNIVTVGEIYG